MDKELSTDDFLAKKKDFSPFLVHLTKDVVDELGNPFLSAKEVLEDYILDERTLKPANHFCYFSPALKDAQNSIQDRFRVVCFTETPIDQINVLLNKVSGRNFKPEPYGLVFKKDYVRQNGGNPVFYVTKEIARPLWDLIYVTHVQGKEQAPEKICKLLALVTVCEQGNDWHWEREWRVVGELKFNLTDVYCGLCPGKDIFYFENKYAPLKFISPDWQLEKILAKGVGK
jgi:hypothetical protein